jgi:hypothetical protein
MGRKLTANEHNSIKTKILTHLLQANHTIAEVTRRVKASVMAISGCSSDLVGIDTLHNCVLLERLEHEGIVGLLSFLLHLAA